MKRSYVVFAPRAKKGPVSPANPRVGLVNRGPEGYIPTFSSLLPPKSSVCHCLIGFMCGKIPPFPLTLPRKPIEIAPLLRCVPPKRAPKGPKWGPKGPQKAQNGPQKMAPRPKSRFYNCNPRRKNGIFAFSKGGHRKKSLFEVLGPPFGPQKAQNGPQKAQIGPQKAQLGVPGPDWGVQLGVRRPQKASNWAQKRAPKPSIACQSGSKGRRFIGVPRGILRIRDPRSG